MQFYVVLVHAWHLYHNVDFPVCLNYVDERFAFFLHLRSHTAWLEVAKFADFRLPIRANFHAVSVNKWAPFAHGSAVWEFSFFDVVLRYSRREAFNLFLHHFLHFFKNSV